MCDTIFIEQDILRFEISVNQVVVVDEPDSLANFRKYPLFGQRSHFLPKIGLQIVEEISFGGVL